jgi:hypothetical protein
VRLASDTNLNVNRQPNNPSVTINTSNIVKPKQAVQLSNKSEKVNGDTQQYITQFYISDQLNKELCDVASTVTTNPYKYILKFRAEAAEKLIPLFPQELIEALNDIANHKGNPAINIQNMPISKNGLCPTPKDGMIPNKTDFVSEAILAAIADVIGGKMATQHHKVAAKSIKKLQKEPIEQIVPNEKINKVNKDYKLVQFIHVEDSNKLNTPDILLVSTLRGDKNAKTVFLPADKIIADLSPEIVETLQKPLFIFRPEEGEEGEVTKGPVLYKDINGNNSICFHTEFEATEGLSKEAEQAIWTLRAYLTDKVLDKATINHKTGDVFLSDNHRSLHGTFPFENSKGQENEYGRWIQRAYLTGTGHKSEVKRQESH